MTSFTALFAVAALFLLVVVFALTYMLKGLKTALIATGASLIILAVLLVGMVFLIVNSMPN